MSVLFTYAFLFSMWIFFNTLLYNCIYKMFTLNLHCYIRYCLQLLSPVYLFCCLHMLSFSQCEYFSTHYCTIVYIKCLHWIFTVTYGTVYNYSPQYTYFAVYICFPFHNANIFPQLLYNFLFHYVYSEASFDTCSTVTISLCFVYTYFPFHNDNV